MVETASKSSASDNNINMEIDLVVTQVQNSDPKILGPKSANLIMALMMQAKGDHMQDQIFGSRNQF